MDKKAREQLDAVMDARLFLTKAGDELHTYLQKRRHGTSHSLEETKGYIHEAKLCIDRLEELR